MRKKTAAKIITFLLVFTLIAGKLPAIVSAKGTEAGWGDAVLEEVQEADESTEESTEAIDGEDDPDLGENEDWEDEENQDDEDINDDGDDNWDAEDDEDINDDGDDNWDAEDDQDIDDDEDDDWDDEDDQEIGEDDDDDWDDEDDQEIEDEDDDLNDGEDDEDDIDDSESDTTMIYVDIIWDDNDDQDGIRPDYMRVKLLADGEDWGEVDDVDSDMGWYDEFYDLDQYADDGQEIRYSMDVVTDDVITGTDGPGTYSFEISDRIEDEGRTGYEITARHTPEVMDLEVAAQWDDNDNAENLRPESITLRVKANGEAVDILTLTEGNEWKSTHTILEDAVKGYTPEVSGDSGQGFTIRNTYTPGKTSISVTKVWKDLENLYGERPEFITIRLLADGNDTGESLTLSEENGWTDVFTGLDEDSENGKIKYTVVEEIPEAVMEDEEPEEFDDDESGDFDDDESEEFDDDESEDFDDEPEDDEDEYEEDYSDYVTGTYESEITGDPEEGFTVINTFVPDWETDDTEKPEAISGGGEYDYSSGAPGSKQPDGMITDHPKGSLPISPPPPRDKTNDDGREKNSKRGQDGGSAGSSGYTAKNTGTKTGDDSYWLFWAAAMMVSLAGVIGVRRRAR